MSSQQQNKRYNINQKDDRGRDGGTNFILRIKEQETHLILHKHDDDDDIPHRGVSGLFHLLYEYFHRF